MKVLTQNLGETLGVKVAPNLAETESCRQLLAGRVSQHPLITHHIPHTYSSTKHTAALDICPIDLVAKPLLSMGTVGSMDCERRAKPLKHTIVTSKRNRLKDETGVALLRGYENLNHLMNAKKLVGKQVHESLLRR